MNTHVPERYFKIFRKSFPFSCVGIIIINEKDEFLLVRRSIFPYKGKWCLPGGIIRYGEQIEKAVHRVAKNELGIEIQLIKKIGFFEKIFHNRHDISHCFLATLNSQSINLDSQASDAKFFSKIPQQTSLFHKKMIKASGIL